MEVVQLEAFGLENIQMRTRPDPVIGERDVLLEMRAASLNSRDYLTVKGVYNPKQKLPLVLCSDGVGEVVDVGSSVTRFSPGDRAIPCFAQGWIEGPLTSGFRHLTLGGPLDGTLSEYMAISEESCVHAPEYLNDAEAATLPCAGLTAWSAVVRQAAVKEGNSVLIEGTGGVAVFAMQFALMLGARPIVISKSDAKLERAREMGADETINYIREPQWHRAVKDLTKGKGVDLVIEVGGDATLQQAVRAVRTSGQLSMVGVLGGAVASLNLPLVVMRNVRLQGVTVGSRMDFESMIDDLEESRIRPVVDRVFDLGETAEAFRYLANAGHFGKVCIRHSEASGQQGGRTG